MSDHDLPTWEAFASAIAEGDADTAAQMLEIRAGLGLPSAPMIEAVARRIRWMHLRSEPASEVGQHLLTLTHACTRDPEAAGRAAEWLTEVVWPGRYTVGGVSLAPPSDRLFVSFFTVLQQIDTITAALVGAHREIVGEAP